MFYVCCRSWVICRLRCWNQWWCGRSGCCMPVTLRMMMTTVLWSYWARPEVPRDERLLCCRQCVGRGIRLWLAGRNHPLHSGWGISWRNWLNVSTHTFVSSTSNIHCVSKNFTPFCLRYNLFYPKSILKIFDGNVAKGVCNVKMLCLLT